jgi:hypothetical protein
MKIKKYKTNEYYLTEDGVWIRNFILDSKPLDINKNISIPAYNLFLKNEFQNLKRKLQFFEPKSFKKIVIISNGFDFENKQKFLSNLNFKDVAILATNNSLSQWKLVGNNCPTELKRAITYYIVNNPYPECTKFLPTKHNYYPSCVASCRTNSDFLNKYKGSVTLYHPVDNMYYSGVSNTADFSIDDYHNSICAAIGLAYKMNVQKLLLLGCDDSFKEKRSSSIQLENGLWTYPQQIFSQNIIDGNLFWLKNTGIEIANCSSGKNLLNATYIIPEHIEEFFKDE